MSIDRRLTAAAEEVRAICAGVDPARRLGEFRGHRRRQVVRRAAVVAAAVVMALGAVVAGFAWTRQHDVGVPVQPASKLPHGSLGQVTASIPVGGEPGAVEGGAGDVWVLRPQAGVVVRVDAVTNRVRAAIPVGGEPAGLGVGPSGVWVAFWDKDVVVRIDPATDRTAATVPVGRGGSPAEVGNFHELAPVPRRIAVAADAVWVPNPADGSVTRIDPSTNLPVATIPLPRATLPPPRHYPQAVSLAGGVWVTDGRTQLAYRIDPGSDRVVASRRVVVPDGVRVLGDSFWAQDPSQNAGWLLQRVDPTSGRTVAALVVGGRVGGAAQAAGAIWLSDFDHGVLLRVEPAG